jgi:hypothetical protein
MTFIKHSPIKIVFITKYQHYYLITAFDALVISQPFLANEIIKYTHHRHLTGSHRRLHLKIERSVNQERVFDEAQLNLPSETKAREEPVEFFGPSSRI